MKKELAVYPSTFVRKLLPDLSPLHRWLHGQMKQKFRDFISWAGESSEMEKIYSRKTNKDDKEYTGWINPEVQFLHDFIFQAIIDKEKLAWQLGDMARGYHVDANPKFWENFRKIVCVTLDEDSYYTLRYLYAVDEILENPEAFNLAMHKNKAYWEWEDMKIRLMEMAKERKMQREGWRLDGAEKG